MSVFTEVFKDVLGYNGDYIVSNLGYIVSLKNGTRKNISTFKHKNGYLTVSLSKDGKVRTHSVHSLVASAFLQKKTDVEYIVIDHKDNNKLNNTASNLQYITNRENSTKDTKENSSVYIGVKKSSWNNGKFNASIRLRGKVVYLCTHESEEYCSEVYNKALKKYRENIRHYDAEIHLKPPAEKRKFLTE